MILSLSFFLSRFVLVIYIVLSLHIVWLDQMLKSTKDEGVMASTKSDFAETLQNNTCLSAVLGFFFNKGVRGGPRVLLNLAAVLVGLFIFIKLLPARMTDSALQRIPIPETVWSGLSAGAGRSGGLRIVVFGELDIGTPVGADPEDDDPKSWTEMLCDQVSCIDIKPVH